MTPQDFHLNFSYQDVNYDVKLVHTQDKESEYSVRINGISYALLGEEEKLPVAYSILNSIQLNSIKSEKDLSGRIEHLTQNKTAQISSILIPKIDSNKEIVNRPEAEMIDVYLQSIAEKTSFRGAVTVVKEGEILLSKGYGKATLTEDNTASTVFHIGSITKQFTAAAIMKLAEKGKIKIDEKINQYLPPHYQSEYWNNVTVKQLLSHTSGLSNYTDDPSYFENCLNLNKDILIKDAMKPLEYPVGEFHYSNTGYLLLGAIIEEQSKLSYREFMEQEFFIPAEMKDTCVHDMTFEQKPNMSLGFRPDDSAENLIVDVTEDLSKTCGADGAIYSTLNDLIKWNTILAKGEGLLTQQSLNEMKTPVVNGYGYGIEIKEKFETKMISHDGLVPGFASSFVQYPEKNIFIAILGNNGKFPSGYLTDYISEVLLNKKGESLTIIPHDFKEDPRIGIFKSTQGPIQIEIYEKKGHLYLKGIDAPGIASECFLLSNGRLFHPAGLQIELKDEVLIVYDEHAKSEENPEGLVDRLIRQ